MWVLVGRGKSDLFMCVGVGVWMYVCERGVSVSPGWVVSYGQAAPPPRKASNAMPCHGGSVSGLL